MNTNTNKSIIDHNKTLHYIIYHIPPPFLLAYSNL